MKHSCPTRRSSVLDQLGLVGDEHELVALRRREAGDDGAVAADVVDIGDALAAAPGAAIFVRRGELAIAIGADGEDELLRSEEHTSELQSIMRNSYAVFCLKKKKQRMN